MWRLVHAEKVLGAGVLSKKPCDIDNKGCNMES